MLPAGDADVLLVGGTCADVAGGNATGVPVLAVATGRTSRTDLDKVFGYAVLSWMIAGCWSRWRRWGRSQTGVRRFGCARRWVPLRRSGAAIRREWGASTMWSGLLTRTWPGAVTLGRPVCSHPGWLRRKTVGLSFGGGWA
ncbi:HAD hydrolase-like protein [Streptomyces sp. DH18]|uniref:HAD hydrolase-like protein n=1 Tax=Streptomyces sp. DH18 TaxID=3040126 RepID=UPI003014BCE1